MLTMQEFCSFIEESLLFSKFQHNSKISMFLPYDNESDLHDCKETLLICTYEDAQTIIRSKGRCPYLNLLVCQAPVGADYSSLITDDNMNLAVSTWSEPKCGNRISIAFHTYARFKRVFDNILNHHGQLHDLLNEAVNLADGKIHVYVYSSNFTLLDSCASGSFFTDQRIEPSSRKNDILYAEQIDLIQRLLVGKNAIENIVTPVVHDGTILAYLLITSKEASLVSTILKFMLTRYIAQLLSGNLHVFSPRQKDLQKLLSDMLILLPDNVEPIYERLRSLPHPITGHMRFLIISRTDKEKPILPLCTALEEIFPNHNITVYDGNAVVLVPGDSFLFKVKMDEKRFTAFLRDQDAYAIFSSPAKFIKGMRTLYLQAIELLPKLPLLMDITEKRFVYFEDVFAFYRVHLCSIALRQHLGIDKIVYLVHPVAIQVIRYDIEHGTDYFEFIVEYCKCRGNIQETASHMHMHRNSAYNKLNRIMENFDVNFSDSVLQRNMVFSMNIIKYNGLSPSDTILFKELSSKDI